MASHYVRDETLGTLALFAIFVLVWEKKPGLRPLALLNITIVEEFLAVDVARGLFQEVEVRLKHDEVAVGCLSD